MIQKKKMSLHVSTFEMRLKNNEKVTKFTELVRNKHHIFLQADGIIDNIAKKSTFSLRILGTSKFIEERCL